jgi:hypothetical protein
MEIIIEVPDDIAKALQSATVNFAGYWILQQGQGTGAEIAVKTARLNILTRRGRRIRIHDPLTADARSYRFRHAPRGPGL